MAKGSLPAKRLPPPSAYEGMNLATPEHSVASDYPADAGEDRVARLEKKIDRLADILDRIDRRSRHLD